jgi:GNAT superfamily N-acetyltransferase
MAAPLYEVRMVRESLRDWRDSPDLLARAAPPLPSPYTLRPYQPGDEATWVAVHREAERHHEITPALFRQQFGTDEERLRARMLFLVEGEGEGAAVGTAAAWEGEGDDAGLGRIHWVAVVPRAQGKGLGKALVAALCRRFVELGHERAYLTTETVRLPAIRMYLSFGFAPEIRGERDRAAWAQVRQEIEALSREAPR